MRKLYVKRQRALACFGTAYHCILGQSREEHIRWAEQQDRKTLMQREDPSALLNGETVCLEMEDAPSSLLVAAYLENRILTTQLVPIPAGTGNLLCTVVTHFDGARRLYLELVPGDPDLNL